MSVTLRDIVLAVRYGDAALVGESAGYLVLGATDLALDIPRSFELDSVAVREDGDIEVDASPCTHAESEAQLRLLLGQLLSLVRTSCPNLQRVAQRKETRGLRGLQTELEAGLVPVNRKAARRSLARLVREARKSAGRSHASMAIAQRSMATINEPPPRAALGNVVEEERELTSAKSARSLPEVDESSSSLPRRGDALDVSDGAHVETARAPVQEAEKSREPDPNSAAPGPCAPSISSAAAPPKSPLSPGGRAAGHSPRIIQRSGTRSSPWTVVPRRLPDQVIQGLSVETPVSEWDMSHRALEEQSEPGSGIREPDEERRRSCRPASHPRQSHPQQPDGVQSPAQQSLAQQPHPQQPDGVQSPAQQSHPQQLDGVQSPAQQSHPQQPDGHQPSDRTESVEPSRVSGAPPEPPELHIDTTPTQIYAPVRERTPGPLASVQPWFDDCADTQSAHTVETAITPQLSEVSARVARQAEDDLREAQQRAREAAARGARWETQAGESLIPEASPEARRRPSSVADLLEKMNVESESEDQVQSGLKQLSRVDLSPLAPPVGSTWIKG